jgi:hypothetical protein
LRGQRFHVYLMVPWHQAVDPDYIDRIRANGGTYTVCANTPEELYQYWDWSVPAILCNHNSMIDWNIFQPVATTEREHSSKEFDFVMNAVLQPYKRHELIPCGYNFARISQPDRDQPVAEHAPPAWKNDRWLLPAEVNAVYNRSRMGLILSEVEGACYASTEYLLAGLPVVSTASLGGRDLFFNSQNSVICEPTIDGVRDAIEAVRSGHWSPDRIRAECMSVMFQHRRHFTAHLSRIISGDGEAHFRSRYVNHLFNWFSSDEKAIEYLHGVL